MTTSNNTILFKEPKAVAEYIFTHMQNEQYDARMSSFYSRYLVHALVEAYQTKKGKTPPAAVNFSSETILTLDEFKKLAKEQERRALNNNAERGNG